FSNGNSLLVFQPGSRGFAEIEHVHTPPPGRVDSPAIRSVFLRDSQRTAPSVQRFDLSTGSLQPAWSPDPNASFRASSQTLFDSPSSIRNKVPGFVVDYRLRALDPPTGQVLWERSYTLFPPVPFVDPQTDPQNDLLVLGWPADSPAARIAASRDASAS